ncbi:hypothetical protein EMEDMD4_590008 [Sinorhizobium medicae]|uniref:Uncharacterized protein n=1 Tax=Sinorhizobium medicae TaxID=110321 RepID=A0A508X488_9HYPH|nr:hypothetical protein EMEDMD4_590008 [Sinorhizobium medicae]
MRNAKTGNQEQTALLMAFIRTN